MALARVGRCVPQLRRHPDFSEVDAAEQPMFMTASSSCARAFGLWRVGVIVFMCVAASFRMRPWAPAANVSTYCAHTFFVDHEAAVGSCGLYKFAHSVLTLPCLFCDSVQLVVPK